MLNAIKLMNDTITLFENHSKEAVMSVVCMILEETAKRNGDDVVSYGETILSSIKAINEEYGKY